MSRYSGGARRILLSLACLALAGACAPRPSYDPGGQCELNTECSARLVCRLGRCRVECREMRDCAVGLECVRDRDGLGACQLPEETSCALASECPDFLVCRFGRCTNACERDVDCPPGARCQPDDAGMLGCRDVADTECQLNSDCAAPYICTPDRRCREQCRTDRDCRDGTRCDTASAPTVCVVPAPANDAGTERDAGTAMDAGDDGGPDASTDAGEDGGTMAPIGPGPPSMGGGFGHTCAARAPDDLRCWGLNTEGQIGDGTTSPAPSPFRHALSGVTMASGGAAHTCAVSASGLACWGANEQGQLGIGAAGARRTSPASVGGLPSAPTDLALGANHTCAIASDRLFCWGDDRSGQLGGGAVSATPVPSPREVALPAAPVQVSAFGGHTCARVRDGRVYCWGENADGQVGSGTIGADIPTPTEVPEARGASHVAAGTTHTCAIVGADVLCWGNNNLGQLGDGTMGPSRGRPMPTMPLGAAALQIALGSTHSCARTAAQVFCWGDNFSGQTGSPTGGATGWRVLEPAAVSGLGATDEVVGGSNHSCARTGASVSCWGSNTDGQLGSAGADTHVPRAVSWP
ncbi:MAG: hypothetical protein KF729_08180 [Sandaracinaceae bacterium]|nr:hypothetical protein [Sandaracinaceae bacterium]